MPQLYVRWICILAGLILSGQVLAAVKEVRVSLGDDLSSGLKVKVLSDMQQAYKAEKYENCLRLGKTKNKKFKIIQQWIALQQLDCAIGAARSHMGKGRAILSSAVEEVWANPDWVLRGAQTRRLRASLIEASLMLVQYDVQRKQKTAWDNINRILDVREWLSSRQRAECYQYAAELSLASQNLTAARQYYERSLKEEPNRKVQASLDAVIQTLEPKGIIELNDAANVVEQTSQAEKKIYERMLTMQNSGDYVAAVEDGVKLLVGYSGGKKANDAAARILSIYLALSAKNEDRFISIKERILVEMKKVDGQRLFDWSQVLSGREYFNESLEMAEASLNALGGQPLATQVLMLSAMSAYHSSNFILARSQFEKLVAEHAGTRIAAEARFRIGLIDFRNKNYAEAASNFERFLSLEYYDDFEQASMYWIWRSKQKLEDKKANVWAQKLADKYPLSYYGLRARMEMAENKLVFPDELKSKPDWTIPFSTTEFESWERFKILKDAGWIEQAQLELGFLVEPSQPRQKLIYSYIWSLAQNFFTSAEVLSRTYSLDSELMSLASLKLAYPLSYMAEIKREASRYKIPPELVMALIKQESSFRTDIRSSAGALGLMQLMPATAREVASDMRVKIRNLQEDLSTPAINIRLGTQYLNRRLRSFKGHVPLALASYNAGIGNIRNWLRARKDLADLEKVYSSAPEDELWIDEMPWTETSGYIKSILKNYVLYQVLDQGGYTASEPLWSMKTP